MELNVNLNFVTDFIESDKFHQFLLSNTTEFETAAFILQSLMDAVENAKASMELATADAERSDIEG